MKYMLLIHDTEAGAPDPDETPEYMAIAQAPTTLHGAELHPPTTATTVRACRTAAR